MPLRIPVIQLESLVWLCDQYRYSENKLTDFKFSKNSWWTMHNEIYADMIPMKFMWTSCPWNLCGHHAHEIYADIMLMKFMQTSCPWNFCGYHSHEIYVGIKIYYIMWYSFFPFNISRYLAQKEKNTCTYLNTEDCPHIFLISLRTFRPLYPRHSAGFCLRYFERNSLSNPRWINCSVFAGISHFSFLFF